MVEELKNLKDNFIKSVFSAVAGVSDSGGTDDDGNAGGTIREIISGLAAIAGKGKDEIVQLVSREIGNAVAGVVKEPLTQILKDRKLKITLELVPKSDPDTPVSTKSGAGATTRKKKRN